MKFFRQEPFGGLIFDSENFSTSFTRGSECPAGAREISHAPFSRTDILTAPVAIYFELTRRCNLHCRQCFASCRQVDEAELKTSEVKAILDQLAAVGVINVRFTGGEPSQRADLCEILSYGKKLGLVVSLQTNGVYAEPEKFIAGLAEVDCDQITVSIDGLGQVHDQLRGPGAFAAVCRSLQIFAAHGLRIRLNLLAHRENLGQLAEIFAFAMENSAGINIFHIRPIGRAREMQHLLPGENDMEVLAARVKTLMAQYPGLSVACSAIGSQRRPAPVDVPVPAGFTALCVAADGRVWPHHYASYLDAGHCLGHMPGDDLQTLWAFSPVLEAFRKTVQEHFNHCDKCLRHGKTCYGFDFESLIIEKQLGIRGGLCSGFSGF